MYTDGKLEASKIMDLTLHAGTQAADKLLILPFTNKIGTDQWAEVLSPAFGQITMDYPVPAVYPSPIHYVEAMKIASLSSMPMNLAGSTMGPGLATPCDNARLALPSLVMQPHASIIKSVADSCSVTGKDWFKRETAHGRFWYSLWIALWAKYQQNPRYAGALFSTGNKLLMYYDSDPIYGHGPAPSNGAQRGMNAVGFLLMLLRGCVAAGWVSQRGPQAVHPGFIFDKWILPAIAAVYTDAPAFA
jgi:hypothetical protein